MVDSWLNAQPSPAVFPKVGTREEALENINEAITAWLWAEDQKALAARPLKTGTTTHRRGNLSHGETWQYFRQRSRQGL